MKNIIKFALFSVTLLSLFSCDKSNQVTDDEWNEAIENITNVNKQNKLNYFASSDLSMSPCGEFDELIINSIEINDNIQEQKYTTIDEENAEAGKKDRTLKIANDGVFSICVSEDNADFSTLVLNELFDMILDLYGNKQFFTFKDNKYRCEEEYKEYYSNFIVEVTFENKLIKSIYMDYKILDNEYSLKGTVSFEYGKSTLSLNSEEQERFDNAYVNVSKDETEHSFTVPGKEGWGGDCTLHFKVETKDIDDRRKFYIQQYNEEAKEYKNISFKEQKDSLIAFDDTILVYGKTAGEGDYYFTDDTVLHFNKDISNGTLRIQLGCSGVAFATEAIVHLEQDI